MPLAPPAINELLPNSKAGVVLAVMVPAAVVVASIGSWTLLLDKTFNTELPEEEAALKISLVPGLPWTLKLTVAEVALMPTTLPLFKMVLVAERPVAEL